MAFHEMTVIEALADEQFLPRYGFPIGLLRVSVLAVTKSDKPDGKPYVREEDQYRLERPGILAMREYVPGARHCTSADCLATERRFVLLHAG